MGVNCKGRWFVVIEGSASRLRLVPRVKLGSCRRQISDRVVREGVVDDFHDSLSQCADENGLHLTWKRQKKDKISLVGGSPEVVESRFNDCHANDFRLPDGFRYRLHHCIQWRWIGWIGEKGTKIDRDIGPCCSNNDYQKRFQSMK